MKPETLEQYLIQFLAENKDKTYPDNYNEIKEAADFIRDNYGLSEELDNTGSELEELRADYVNMRDSADDVIDNAMENMNRIIEAAQDVLDQCRNWMY